MPICEGDIKGRCKGGFFHITEWEDFFKLSINRNVSRLKPVMSNLQVVRPCWWPGESRCLCRAMLSENGLGGQETFYSGISSQMTLYSEELEHVLTTYVCKSEPSQGLPNPSHPPAPSCCCPVAAISVCVWVSFRIRFTGIVELLFHCCTLFAILSSLSQFASVVILIWSISFGDGSRWESSSIELHIVTQNNGQNGTPLHIYFHFQFIFLLI